MNLMMTDENNRDIYITVASMPPPKPCSYCCPVPTVTTIRTGEHTCTKKPQSTSYFDSIYSMFDLISPQEVVSVWNMAMCSTAGTR